MAKIGINNGRGIGINNPGTTKVPINRNFVPPPILIIKAGESNSGGLAPNSSASAPELASRSEIQLLNNTSLTAFYNLDIGTNNLTGHAGLEYAAATDHGWELQIANRVAEGDFGRNPIYMAACGQGGTKIAEWAIGATYSGIQPYTLFLDRVEAAKSLIIAETGQSPQMFILWSLGINDGGVGTTTATFKTALKALFNQMRFDLGVNIPIIMTLFNDIPEGATYNTVMGEIATELSSVYTVTTTGAAEIADGYHWNYLGMKQVANSLVDKILTIVDNEQADTTIPTVLSATAINSTTIRVVFSELIAATNIGWSFKKNGAAHNPTSVSGSGTATLDFTVPTMTDTDVILRSYDSSTGDTMDGAGNELVSFTDQAVTNEIVGDLALTFNNLDANVTESPAGTWTASSDSRRLSYSTESMAGNGHIGMDLPGTNAIDGSVFGFDTDSTLEIWTTAGSCNWQVCVFVAAGTLYTAYTGLLSTTQINHGSVTGIVKVRLTRTGSTIKLQKSTDGTTFTDVATITGTYSGTLYAKGFISTNGKKIINPKKSGFA